MNATILVLTMATFGVETGWKPVDHGGLEYIIQIEPPLLDALKNGQAITSEIPPAVEGVRRYRIVVGEAKLPRIGLSTGKRPAGAATAPGSGTTAPAVSAPSTARGSSAPRYPAMPPPPRTPTATSTADATVPPTAATAVPPAAAAAPAGGTAPADGSTAAPTGNREPSAETNQAGVQSRSAAVPPASVTSPSGSDRYPRQPDTQHPAGKLPSTPKPAPSVHFPLPTSGPADAGAKPSPAEKTMPERGNPGSAAAARSAPDAVSPLPNGFRPDPRSEDIEAVAHQVPAGSEEPAGTVQENPGAQAETATPKPWFPLTITLVGLFGSLGGNVYLGWIAWDSRRHYRALARQSGS